MQDDNSIAQQTPFQSQGPCVAYKRYTFDKGCTIRVVPYTSAREHAYLQLLPQGDALQGSSPSQFLGSSMSSNELLVRHFEAADLPGQRQGALLVVGVEHMLQDMGVKVCTDVAVTLLNGGLDAL